MILAGFSDRPELNGTHEAWILATLPRALAYARSLLRDRALAEDVTHDCYVRLLAKAATYDLPRDGTKLLYKAITNACIDKNYRDRKMVSLEAEALDESAAASPLPGSRANDPHELAAHRELEEAVAVELEGLDGRPARCPGAEKPGILARRDRRSPGHEFEQCRGPRAPGAKNPGRPARQVPRGGA